VPSLDGETAAFSCSQPSAARLRAILSSASASTGGSWDVHGPRCRRWTMTPSGRAGAPPLGRFMRQPSRGQLGLAYLEGSLERGALHVNGAARPDVEVSPAVGSGMLGTPWVRMHWAYINMVLRYCCTLAWVGWPPFGSRCRQAGCLGRLELRAAHPDSPPSQYGARLRECSAVSLDPSCGAVACVDRSSSAGGARGRRRPVLVQAEVEGSQVGR
jgi:hypothetical protein